jgi:TPR repeat protein
MHMSIDDQLAAAATSISSMPDTILRARLDDLEAEHRQRSRLAGARRSAAVESIELDWAAYQLGCHYDDDGDLEAAARWYRMAAASDFADAALRLGCVLDMLASQRTATGGPGYSRSEREALVLVSEAARWYAEAFAAGHPEAAERLDGMISRHDPEHPIPPAPPPPAASTAAGNCREGGLDAIINGSDLITAMTHIRHCTACQREFVSRDGLLPVPESRGSQEDPASLVHP